MTVAPGEAVMTVEAEVRVPIAAVQLVHFRMTGPCDGFLREDACWLDLCLTPRPRNARGCFHDHWSPRHFERIGNLFLVPPRQTLHARSDGNSTQASILCHLRQDPVRQWFGEDLDWTAQRLEAGLDITNATIRGLLLRLAEEVRHPGFASEMLVELMAAQIAIELGRHWAALEEQPASGGLASWRLRLIDERLQEVRAAPTLAELAELCHLSIRQLARGFRASRGYSIGDHVAQCRIEHAKRLLATDQSVKTIAYSLGFASPSSFSFAFRSATGQTPSEFRHGVLQWPHEV